MKLLSGFLLQNKTSTNINIPTSQGTKPQIGPRQKTKQNGLSLLLPAKQRQTTSIHSFRYASSSHSSKRNNTKMNRVERAEWLTDAHLWARCPAGTASSSSLDDQSPREGALPKTKTLTHIKSIPVLRCALNAKIVHDGLWENRGGEGIGSHWPRCRNQHNNKRNPQKRYIDRGGWIYRIWRAEQTAHPNQGSPFFVYKSCITRASPPPLPPLSSINNIMHVPETIPRLFIDRMLYFASITQLRPPKYPVSFSTFAEKHI